MTPAHTIELHAIGRHLHRIADDEAIGGDHDACETCNYLADHIENVAEIAEEQRHRAELANGTPAKGKR